MHRRGFVVALSEIIKDIDEVKASAGSMKTAFQERVWLDFMVSDL